MGFLPRTSMQAPLIIDISTSRLLRFLANTAKLKSVPQHLNLENSQHKGDILHSVRAAWDLFFQSQKFPAGSEIILSGINIKHMREIVTAHGLVPVFADIRPDTLLPSLAEIASKRNERTVGVLCAHLFGTWSPLSGIAEWCHSEKLFLVEDCAQAFMGKDFHGTPEATATLFSFGTIKRASALGGCVAIFRDASIRKKILEIESNYPIQDDKKLKKKAAKILAIKSACEKHAYAVLMKALQLKYGTHEEVLRESVRGFPSGKVPHVFRVRTSNLQRQLVIDSWNESSKSVWTKRANDMFLAAHKSKISPQVFLGYKAQIHTFWLIPVTSQKPDHCIQEARLNGWDATRGVTSMTALAENPNTQAARILKNIVYLPASQRLIPNFQTLASALKNSPATLG